MKCDRCKNKFEPELDPGALVFSPPVYDTPAGKASVKLHICSDCWPKVAHFCITGAEQLGGRGR